MSVTITVPADGAKVSGTITVSATLSDSKRFKAAALLVDGAQRASTTTLPIRFALNTTLFVDGTHMLQVSAHVGNSWQKAQVAVTVANAISPPPPPPPPPAPPIAAFTGTPLAGVQSLTTAFTDMSSGSPTSWSWAFGDGVGSMLRDPSHAYPMAGNFSVSLTVANSAGSHTLTKPDYISVSAPSTPPGVTDQIVTPEGATIQIYSDTVGGWTAQKLYDLLKLNAYELTRIGTTLTIKLQGQYASATSTGVTGTPGTYTNFHATNYLQATSTATFTNRPDDICAHEYGHAWTLYHLYLSQQGSWASYLDARGISVTDPRLESSYSWNKREMIADDYRLLFGSTLAQSQAAYLNPDIPDPREISGLKTFFTNVWGAP